MADLERNIEYISLEKLLFDPENPRLPSTIDKKSERDVLDWMLQDATIIELMGAIGEKDYFPGEPVLVVPSIDKPGFFIVVEGNRRFTAVKLLRQPELAPRKKKSVESVSETAKYKPEKLPTLKFENRNEILDYLGYRHITGIKEWDPLAKARYLRQLYERSAQDTIQDIFQELAKAIGTSKNYVQRLLTGLAIYEEIAGNDFFDIKDLDEENINFSVLTTALNYNGIVKHLGLETAADTNIQGVINKNALKELTEWLFKKTSENRTRLGESRNLKLLNAVVLNEKALGEFRKGSPLREAVRFTEAPTEIFQKAIRKAKGEMQIALSNIHLLQSYDQADREVLEEIEKLAIAMKALYPATISES